MSGKSYTLNERKAIVDYLVDNKAYGEIKGRKMWMNFSNSQLTNRSWQSLKETFLKRILPDIHNPYYKLTMDQIRSFRKGFDVRESGNNKLEVHTLSEDSVSNAENEKDKEQPSTSKYNDENKTSGEDVKSSLSSRNRASVDTVILDNSYDNAEDVLRDLESSSDTNAKDDDQKTQSKSLRDLITYSEPLTPMLQEVLHDFATDDETDSGEPKMQIVEKEPEAEKLRETSPRKVPDAVNDNANINKENSGHVEAVHETENFVEPKVKSLRLRKRQGVYVPVQDVKSSLNARSDGDLVSSNNMKPFSKTNLVEVSEPAIILSSGNNENTVDTLVKSHPQSTQNCSSSTTDTNLPNNQEALDDKTLPETKNTSNDRSDGVNKVTRTRKRAVSQDTFTNVNSLKSNENIIPQKEISASDTNVNNREKDCPKGIDTNNIHTETVINHNIELLETRENTKTILENDTHLPPNNLLNTNDKILNTSTQSSQVNPCLQSMSLYAEQFNNHLASDSSDSGVNPADKSDQRSEKTIDNKRVNEIVMLRSHSDSDSETTKRPVKLNTNCKVLSKTKRDNALANVFGFSNGAVSSKRKKRLSSFRKVSTSCNYHGNNSSSQSSEWTSESDSDYVSPPRGRKNRTMRKYLKPKSSRIHSLEEEGGLFVMYGKKIYPLVKDGKTVKNYTIYSPDSDPDEEENYWKMKYIEERKRVEELKKFITKSQREDVRVPSPLLPSKSSRHINRNHSSMQNRRPSPAVVISSDNDKETAPKETVEKKEPVSEPKNKTLKITFAKNNQEVHLEGHWSQLHPVLADVVEIFHKDIDATKESNGKNSEPNAPIQLPKEKSPIVLSPVDEEIHEKVNKIETEIFKEIEQRDQEELVDTKLETENNVTKRKRPNRLSNSSTETSNSTKPTSPSSNRVTKRAKVAKDVEDVNHAIEKDTTDKESESKEVSNNVDETETAREMPLLNKKSRKSSAASVKKQTPKKDIKGKEKSDQSITTNDKRIRRPKAVFSLNANKKSEVDDEDDDVRYMLPPEKKASKKSTSGGKANQQAKQYSINIPSTTSAPNLSQNSDSTQGYQDSDISPPKLLTKKKRRLSLSTIAYKNKSKLMRMKRKSHPIITNEESSDSNNSCHITIKSTNEDNSLKSDEYRSESYQMLMTEKQDKFKPLEKIEEGEPLSNNNNSIGFPNIDILKEKVCMNINNDNTSPMSNLNADGVNSSNVSLPLSPEISIVENLTVSKLLINSVVNNHPQKESQTNEMPETIVHRKSLMSQMDVSMPLTQQECEVHRTLHKSLKSDFCQDETENLLVSDSILHKMSTDDTEGNASLGVSLDTRLKELLLDSAKKMTVEKDNIEANSGGDLKKTRSSRCSTPRKRKEIKKTKLTVVDPVIEEECMEFCSRGGRKSCPPILEVAVDEIGICENVATDDTAPNKSKARKKKDIIKVKITKPKAKNQKVEKRQSKVKNASRVSIPVNCHTEDNESGISIQDTSDGIDLIHNHSETCLQANECIGDSVEFLEMTPNSIISVNSNSNTPCDCKIQQQLDFHDCVDISLFCYNARDGTKTHAVCEPVKSEETSDTVFHSPSNMSLTSLITEDLSDENPPRSQSTKWYLLSDDETNTNADQNLNALNFGANLKQLFPLTCSVPNLSTITEMSKENEDNSRKTTLEGSIYDSNMNALDSHGAFNLD